MSSSENKMITCPHKAPIAVAVAGEICTSRPLSSLRQPLARLALLWRGRHSAVQLKPGLVQCNCIPCMGPYTTHRNNATTQAAHVLLIAVAVAGRHVQAHHKVHRLGFCKAFHSRAVVRGTALWKHERTRACNSVGAVPCIAFLAAQPCCHHGRLLRCTVDGSPV